jgi:hypothetical protein
MRKTTENIKGGSRWPGRVPNRTFARYKSVSLPVESTCSVWIPGYTDIAVLMSLRTVMCAEAALLERLTDYITPPLTYVPCKFASRFGGFYTSVLTRYIPPCFIIPHMTLHSPPLIPTSDPACAHRPHAVNDFVLIHPPAIRGNFNSQQLPVHIHTRRPGTNGHRYALSCGISHSVVRYMFTDVSEQCDSFKSPVEDMLSELWRR